MPAAIEAGAEATPTAPVAAAPAPAATSPLGRAAGGTGQVTVEPLSRSQQVVARRMQEAKSTVPEFTVSSEIDMGECVALRARLKRMAAEGEPVPSYNDMVVKAAALALRDHPRVNGSFREEGFALHERVNVGVAVAAGDGLLVPTVFDADRLSLRDVAARGRALIEAVRGGTIAPDDLAGGTFTVSNLGMFGVSDFTAVLNLPQAAILAVGALEQVPVVRDGALVPGHRLRLTLTCDHRIVYGADAARFLARLRELLEEPLALLV
ncbi:2-oxo acid dehydrogenase subunit E2 [Patulibacter defluvii]|uniref:2-oxo acid dehydrogenase subunit E2 n=1 Tax=Patulibacter defluvii TaxID=3095358 RepID=UPI002A753EA8|nr:2-oxo acid dehydrogenase subunit E2 [Patulibacter sp. DM4]